MTIPQRDNPFDLFNEWFDKAKKNKKIEEATAMSLATSTPGGMPNVRLVLLKKVDNEGFTFYTNIDSQKGRELLANPLAALCFYWPPLGKQIRIQGNVKLIPEAVSDAYFATRSRQSQVGAWASSQSQPMKGPWELKKNVAKFMAKYSILKIPRPPYWQGFKIIPHRFEFWKERTFRLHERLRYDRSNDTWEKTWLFP